MHKLTGLMLLAVALAGKACFAARPLTVDDTDPIPYRSYQFDLGIEHATAEGGNFGFPTNLTYGVKPGLQILVGTGVTVQNNGAAGRVRGLNDVGFVSKLKFYDQAQRRKQRKQAEARGNLKMSLGASLKLPTASRKNGLGSGSTDVGGLFLLTYDRGKTACDCNGGYTLTGKGAPDVFDYGVALRRNAGKLRPVGEIVGSTTCGEGTEFLFDVGVQYDKRSNITLDAAIGHGLGSSQTGLFLTVGFTKNF